LVRAGGGDLQELKFRISAGKGSDSHLFQQNWGSTGCRSLDNRRQLATRGATMRFRVLISAFLTMFFALAGAAHAQTIFAAASMTDAIRQINDVWVAKGNEPFKFSFASSSTLAQ